MAISLGLLVGLEIHSRWRARRLIQVEEQGGQDKADSGEKRPPEGFVA
jgi:hypothetical protein